MAQLKRYNGASWDIVGGIVTGDTLPIGSEIDYDGATAPAGWQEVEDYSTTEINTGKKWIDGKPIYRKCFSQNNINNIATGITNIDSMIKMECLIKQTSTGDWRNLPWLFTGGQAGWQGGFFYKASDQEISFQVGSDLGQVQKTILILEYTKTTD